MLTRSNLGRVKIVKEFSEVFPNDLPGLCPKCETGLEIKLVLDVTPTTKPPYRMASIKLKELKTQLQELSEIRLLGMVCHLKNTVSLW